MILLDTNVISEPQRREPNARVLEWIDAQALETLYLSAITVAELLAKSRAVGLAVETADAFIAAVANGFAVATRETRPFEAAGLDVINPWEASPRSHANASGQASRMRKSWPRFWAVPGAACRPAVVIPLMCPSPTDALIGLKVCWRLASFVPVRPGRPHAP
jgi:predicted nucleic acid-binding protein